MKIYLALAITLTGCATTSSEGLNPAAAAAETFRQNAQQALLGGDVKLARGHLGEAIALKTKSLSEDHPDLLGDYLQMANLHQGEGSHEQAEGFLLKAMKIIGKGVGFVTPFASAVVDNLAGNFVRQGRTEDAEKTYRNAIAEIKKTHGADHPAAIDMMEKLAHVKELRGDFKESISILEDVYKAKKTRLGMSDRQVADHAHTLGKKYAQSGDLTRAQSTLTEALDIGKRAFGTNHIRTTQMTKDLGEVMVHNGHEQDAIDLFEASMREKTEKLQLVGGDMVDYLDSMAKAHDLRGEKVKAARARTRQKAIRSMLAIQSEPRSLPARRLSSE